jgi:hypothetical protein
VKLVAKNENESKEEEYLGNVEKKTCRLKWNKQKDLGKKIDEDEMKQIKRPWKESWWGRNETKGKEISRMGERLQRGWKIVMWKTGANPSLTVNAAWVQKQNLPKIFNVYKIRFFVLIKTVCSMYSTTKIHFLSKECRERLLWMWISCWNQITVEVWFTFWRKNDGWWECEGGGGGG